MKSYCYADGEIKLLAKTALRLDDLGLLRGYAIFDYLRTVNGKPFLLTEHLSRFRLAAQQLGLKLPLSDQAATSIITRLIKKNNCANCSIRLVLTAGRSSNGFDAPKHSTFFILVQDLIQLPLEVYRRGGKLITCQYQRPCPGIKTTNYLLAMTLQAAKRRAGAIEILYTDRGWVLEASTSNFGAFFGDVLVAPKENVLLGITRATVLRLAKPFFRVSERNLKLSELARADEAFIMATNKNVAPIVSIDGKSIGRGRVGERTQKLMALFAEFMKSH